MTSDLFLRPKVNVLIPVWGASYTGNMLRYHLPSLMAPGNLPALSKACETELIFLTTRADFKYISSQKIFEKISSVSKIKLIEIDDLLIDVLADKQLYGYTLTYAYMRGISSTGSDMIKSHFIFLVSDYILGENCFTALIKHIKEDKKVIVSGSLRVDKKKSEDYIDANNFFEEDVLKISHRNLVKIAINFPHPSFISKIINHGFSFSYYYQHLYWLVDQNTILGRFFMAHMLCLKPEVITNDVVGFSDFSFIPNLCPTSDFTYLNDSDDFVVIELQNREHEMSFSHYGSENFEIISNKLGQWTTKEHRKFPFQDFVFHADEIPSAYEKIKEESGRFINSIHSKFKSPPVSHVNHPYWHFFYENYLKIRGKLDMEFLLPFLSPLCQPDAKTFKKHSHSMVNLDWLDHIEIIKEIPIFFSGLKKVLLVSNLGSTILEYLEPYQEKILRISTEILFNTQEIEDKISDNIRSKNVADENRLFDGLLFILNENEIKWMPGIIKKALKFLMNDGKILIYINNTSPDIYLYEYVDKLFFKNLNVTHFSTVINDPYRRWLKKYQKNTFFARLFKKIATAIVNMWRINKNKTIKLDLPATSLLVKMEAEFE